MELIKTVGISAEGFCSSKPLVSVVMSIYNGEMYLQEQIDSILNQTYKNLEIIMVDDCSSDESTLIITQVIEKDARAKLFRNEVNLGFNQSFAKGFSLATGDLIAVSDQDDIWNLNKIEELVNGIQGGILIYSNSSLIDKAGRDIPGRLNDRISHINNPSFKSFLDGNFITGHTCLFRKELLDFILPIPEGVLYYDWWIGFVASNAGRIQYSAKQLTKYRIHSESVIQKIERSHDSRTLKTEKNLSRLEAFASYKYLEGWKKQFILKFISKKVNAVSSLIGKVSLFTFLVSHHREIYPWYNKTYLKKLNFLRKQCL